MVRSLRNCRCRCHCHYRVVVRLHCLVRSTAWLAGGEWWRRVAEEKRTRRGEEDFVHMAVLTGWLGAPQVLSHPAPGKHTVFDGR